MLVFYVNAAIAIVATTMAVVANNAVHVLLYFVLSLLSLAFGIYLLGSPFAAALEVIVYAGAIMVLFVFVVMLLNVRPIRETKRLGVRPTFLFPGLLAACLVGEMIWALNEQVSAGFETAHVPAKEVAILMFNRYGIGVEIASMLLLAGLVGACHIGARKKD